MRRILGARKGFGKISNFRAFCWSLKSTQSTGLSVLLNSDRICDLLRFAQHPSVFVRTRFAGKDSHAFSSIILDTEIGPIHYPVRTGYNASA
jgi:hypothetical protein